MPAVGTPRPWPFQPPFLPRVAWRKPICQGLVRLVWFADGWPPIDLVTGQQLTQVGTAFAPGATRHGRGKSNTSETSYWTLPKRSEDLGFMSMGWVGSMASGTSQIIVRDATGSGGTIMLWRNSGWDLRLGGTDFTAGGTFDLGTGYAACVTSTQTASKIFVDGKQVLSGGTGVSGVISPWYLHQNGTGAQGCIATTVLWPIWDRGISDADAFEFTMNPYVLIEDDWDNAFISTASPPPPSGFFSRNYYDLLGQSSIGS